MPKINQEEYEVLKELDDKWKWIARTHLSRIYVYDHKPWKESAGWVNYNRFYKLVGNLFQFIKEDDHEPYSIVELIEEYEHSAEHVSHVVNKRVKALGNARNESEETEVKDIEWAKKQIDLRDVGTTDEDDPQFYVDTGLRLALDFLDQLDEPETTIQDAHDKLKEVSPLTDKSFDYYWNAINDGVEMDERETLSSEWLMNNSEIFANAYGSQRYVAVENLENILVPKQEITGEQFVNYAMDNDLVVFEKQVISQEWFEIIKMYKENETDLWMVFDEQEIFDDECDEFARAWLAYPDIEVEEEQKYNVKLKVKSSFGTVGIFLYKEGDEILAGDNFRVYYPKEEKCMLTEQEIRGFQNGDVLFEHFAVKAEELEE